MLCILILPSTKITQYYNIRNTENLVHNTTPLRRNNKPYIILTTFKISQNGENTKHQLKKNVF